MSEGDELHAFLMECDQICKSAQFVIDTLPNAEHDAVEGAVRHLEAIRTILGNVDDAHTDFEALWDYVDILLLPLETHLNTPPPLPSSFLPRVYTGRVGRPSYAIDLERAVLLHDLGNTWKDTAKALGIARSTLYEHMDKAGLSTAKREWSDLTNDELDEVIAEFSLAHPFSGTRIVMGHLETLGFHLPRHRVLQSLHRVDEIGVLTRYVQWYPYFPTPHTGS